MFTLNINSKIIALTDDDIAIGKEKKVSYNGENFRFLLANMARIKATPIDKGTEKIVNLNVFPMDFKKVALENTRTKFSSPTKFLILLKLSVKKNDLIMDMKKG
jgi:hypothetical protein